MTKRPRRRWLWGLVLIPVLAGGAYLYCGARMTKGPAAKATAGKVLYHCPMHPTYVSDHPGDCPICGMRLVPFTPGSEHTPTAGNAATLGPKVSGQAMVTLSPQMQQVLGVTLVTAERTPLTKDIRATGQVTADEKRVTRVYSKVGGWVEKLYVNFTGTFVKEGQPLLSIYSPELVSTQEEYLTALKERGRLRQSTFAEIAQSGDDLVEASRERLKLWDVPDAEIRRIEQAGRPVKTLTLYAPSSGYVMEKSVLEGQKIDPSMSLLTVADLSTVWIDVDFYEQDAAAVRVGDRAELTVNAYPGHIWAGVIDYIYPSVDPQTRTLRARLRISNRGGLLKPGMYANVEIRKPLGSQLTVPSDAVLDSGTRQLVFLARPDGYFEPRQVTIGQRTDDRVEILGGLQPGEKIVSNGNFLIDSESKLQSALADMTAGQGAKGSGGGTGASGGASGKSKKSMPSMPGM